MSQHGCPERLSNRSKGFAEEGAGQATMEVLVETLTGTAFEMTVSPSDTIFAIKSKIFRVEGIPVGQQHLLYNLKELEDASSLGSHAIGDGARLRLVLGMRGGPISTRRLPPPPLPPPLPLPLLRAAEPWRDLERLLDNTREDGAWSRAGSGGGGGGGGSSSGAGGGGGGSGCKVTVLVFRDGDRVNMLRVRENKDGTIESLDHAKYPSSLWQLVEPSEPPAVTSRASAPGAAGAAPGAVGAAGAGAARDNALTQHKMRDLRRRMETLSLLRRTGEPAEIVKSRSEETLASPRALHSLHSLHALQPHESLDTLDTLGTLDAHDPLGSLDALDELDALDALHDAARARGSGPGLAGAAPAWSEAAAAGRYTRYDYDCSFADRYTLLPPIGSRAGSERSVQEEERLALPEALSGSVLLQRGRTPGRGGLGGLGSLGSLGSLGPLGSLGSLGTLGPLGADEEDALLEGAVDACLRRDALAAEHVPTAEYGPLVGGRSGCSERSERAGGWRAVGFGSSSSLAPPAPLAASPPAHAHSASALHMRAAPHAPHAPSPYPAAAPRPAAAPPAPLGTLGTLGGRRAGAHPPLGDALFSSSTSDLEKLKRNRILPALSRHRNREHLHLSDERLDLAHRDRHHDALLHAHHTPHAPHAHHAHHIDRLQRPHHAHHAPPAHYPHPRRLDYVHRISRVDPVDDVDHVDHTDHVAASRPRNLEVGSERRQRRIEKIAELESSRLFRYGEAFEDARREELKPDEAGEAAEAREAREAEVRVEAEEPKKERKPRCGLCRKRLSISTQHTCRCGSLFCAPHRYAEVHGCRYDYKADALRLLRVQAPKLPEI